MSDVVAKVDGEFVLPLAGFVCSGLEDGYVNDEDWAHVDLILHDDPFTRSARVRIGGGQHRPTIVELVARRAHVESSVCNGDSELCLTFDGGGALAVPPHPKYEAWDVAGPGLVKAVATPGGGEPAIWDASTPTHTFSGTEEFEKWFKGFRRSSEGEDE